MPLTVKIITPEKALPEIEADQVVLPAFDGQVGILPKHAAYICTLGNGTLHVKNSEDPDHKFALCGGVAQVLNDEVRILAEAVVDAYEMDEASIVRQLQELDAAEYSDSVELAKAQSQALLLVTELRCLGSPSQSSNNSVNEPKDSRYPLGCRLCYAWVTENDAAKECFVCSALSYFVGKRICFG